VVAGQLTREENTRCETDANARLAARGDRHPDAAIPRQGGALYPGLEAPGPPRRDFLAAQAHPELTDPQIVSLIGTTKSTIAAVRDKTHWNAVNIKARNPVTLGLCSEADLEKAVVLPRDAAACPPPHRARPLRGAAERRGLRLRRVRLFSRPNNQTARPGMGAPKDFKNRAKKRFLTSVAASNPNRAFDLVLHQKFLFFQVGDRVFVGIGVEFFLMDRGSSALCFCFNASRCASLLMGNLRVRSSNDLLLV
jgi:hypothetical protein